MARIFGKGVGRGQDSLQESESFNHSNRFACCLLLSVLDTVLETKVLANKCKKIFPASICSKDLLGIIMKFLVFLNPTLKGSKLFLFGR